MVFHVVVVAISVSHLVTKTQFFSHLVNPTLIQASHPKWLFVKKTKAFVQKTCLYNLTRKTRHLKELAENSEFLKDFKMGLHHLPYLLFKSIPDLPSM